MKKCDEFVDYLLEPMQPLGPVSAKAMPGGCGICIDDLIFALVAGDVPYPKTEAGNLTEFEKQHLSEFRYERNGRMINLSYQDAPAETAGDTEAAKLWYNKATAAALNSGQRKETDP